MIGKFCTLLMPYYDAANKRMSIKARPALVIGMADSEDMTVLPVSKVSDYRRVNATYDLKVEPSAYPRMNLKTVSYIRTNKVYTANKKEVGSIVCDLKAEYFDLYMDAIKMFKNYVASI